ncbi:MAG: hypothetical protein KA731_00160 [Candidatus Moranbacteria bacterium]|nr:hypothetical protein [Candidatus Moranbacteria bacterium]MBP6034424.1 hypothetical protein [Candidatus Moranbacteria bacterium]MBP7695707.1 hypothetical protein [Candidatus Moranbacteria bacterium]
MKQRDRFEIFSASFFFRPLSSITPTKSPVRYGRLASRIFCTGAYAKRVPGEKKDGGGKPQNNPSFKNLSGCLFQILKSKIYILLPSIPSSRA